MSATPEAINANAVPCIERTYGVHDWSDRYGNHGTEVLGRHHVRFRAVRADGLFDPGSEKTRIRLADYFYQRKVFVVVDSHLPQSKRTQIEDYFVWCNMEKLLEDYMITPFATNETEKTLGKVTVVIRAAKQFGMRRRDLFVAIGSTMVTDIVGFAAAIYHRSAPYISVPTDPVGIVYSHVGVNKVSINHINNDGKIYRGMFALSHLPIASFYDLSFLDSLHKNEITRGLAEIVKISVVKDDVLFSYVEAHLEKLLAGTPGEHLTTALELASRAAFEELSKDPWGKDAHLSAVKFGDEAVQAIGQIKGITYDDAHSVAMGVALVSAMSFLKRNLSGSDLGRVLSVLEKAGLPICDETLEAYALWERMMGVIQERGGDSAFVVPMTLGKGRCLNFSDISPEDIDAALNILRNHCPKIFARFPEVEVGDIGDGCFEWTASEDVQYHVVSVPEIFSRNNPTVIQNYCVDHTDGRKKKILIVVDDYLGNTVADIGRYFTSHSSAIDELCIVSMHVSGKCKDTSSVLRVIDAAVGLRMSQRDLFVVVGGGTLMDVVGFAAAIYKGGIRYVRIPTTLVGIIDAGVGVKVGVNLGDHKNFIGRYFAPVACLNDPATFLVTLPQREFACGLAEAIKMAVLKSPRLFELIERHHRNVEYNAYTHELIQISIRTMLEELQPNLHEQSLCRLVDFGHEFGHIIESLASYEIPHGECVAIGMAISTFLAHLKGILSRADLERILYLILDMGLPIYVTDYDCCNPNLLWVKICTQGIEHKDGMLYLAVPETIGRASFLDNISDIDADMVRESVLGLRRYTDWYTGKNALRTNGFNEVGLSAKMDALIFRDDVAKEEMNPDPTLARHMLGRDLIPISLGSPKTIDGYVQSSRQAEPIICLQYPETFQPRANEDFVPETTLKFARSGDGFHINAGVSRISKPLERSLNKWFSKLPTSHQEALTEYVSIMTGLPIRLRADAAMTQLGEFTIEEDGQHGHQGIIDLHAGLATRACHTDSQEKIDDVVGHEGYHLLAFLLRGRKPLLFDWEREREEAMAGKWQDFLVRQEKPHVLAVDVGATYLRIGVLGPNGLLLPEPARTFTPSKQSYPHDTLAKPQERLVETLIREIDIVRARHTDLSLEEVGISFGAVITREGIVEDASILWANSARGYDFKNALQERLPGVRLTILNDVSAAAWRYKDEGRFCLITVSSGLSNKVFNSDLCTLDKLDLDAAGVGGEMGHVMVEPRAVDALVRHSIMQATAHAEEFRRSQLNTSTHGDVQKINARYLGMAVKEGDDFALRLLEEADVPYCPCGNLADLCSYSSGRGALRCAKRLAAQGNYDIASNDITDSWLKEAIVTGHPLALKVLYDSTYPLALRILQLAADIGLDKFIIVGGFAMKTGERAYLQALQDHLVRFCHNSAFFADWTEDQVRGLVKFGVGDDNDSLIGVGHFVQHLRAQYHAVEKSVGGHSLALVTRSIPRCGAREILAKVVYSGICTTDLQILRSERGLEPTVLGHEGICQVLEVGKDVKGLSLGSMVVLNPNNPLDEHDKLGHTREGLFQQFVKFGQEFLERKQVLVLEDSAASTTDTLIEPLSCVGAALVRIKDRIAGKNVLVVGAGVMGLLFVLMNVKYGARNVFLANRSKGKLDFAVAKGIIQQDKVFVIGKSVSSQVDQVSASEGADIVIITVSMGQGVLATKDAVNYVNAGGCVYLFAGFRPGDILSLDGGLKVDVTSIRSGWKTERIQIDGKPVDISGHRGSGYEDLAMAASLIRGDSLSFGRVISHIISLDVLPEIMLTLAREGNILGVPAKRVVVDMDARDRVVEFAEELPLRHLNEATRKRKDAIPRGNLFREIGFEGNTSMLGWVCPPAWREIEATLETALQINALTSKSDFIFCGTGGWVFLVDALKEIIPTSHGITIHTLQSLDPQALVDLFSRVKDISMAVCLGISQSGRTLETVMLMNALRERFDSAGLDYREHFVWLTDKCKSVHDRTSGEAAIRASKEHDWKNVDIVPLTVKNHSDINALFCAPHSIVMFLTLVLLLRKETEAVRHIYQQYLALREGVVHGILPKANSVASNHIEHIQMNLDESIAPVMVRLVTQLIAQGLGSKQVGFNPRVRVASSGRSAGFDPVALPMPAETPAVVKVMLTMNALAVFVATVAYHRRIAFVTHPKVDMYKLKAVELVAATEVEERVSDPGPISAEIIAYLGNNPRTHFVEVICYGLVSASHRKSVKDWLASCFAPRIPGILSIDVVQGEEWNHSVYQAAVQTEDTLYVILVLQKYCSNVEGVSKGAIYGNIRMLQAIARATYETLRAKALYFRVGNSFSVAALTDIAGRTNLAHRCFE